MSAKVSARKIKPSMPNEKKRSFSTTLLNGSKENLTKSKRQEVKRVSSTRLEPLSEAKVVNHMDPNQALNRQISFAYYEIGLKKQEINSIKRQAKIEINCKKIEIEKLYETI